MKVTQLPPHWFEDITAGEGATVWQAVEPLLQRACDHADNRFSPEILRKSVLARSMQLWVAFNDNEEIRAVAVTHLGVFPNGDKTAEIIALGGEQRAEWLPLFPVMVKWAEKEECCSISFQGRKGWAKDLPEWKVSTVNYELRL